MRQRVPSVTREGTSPSTSRSRRRCAKVAHAGGGLGQAQHLGRLAVGELLEVAEHDDLAIVILQAVKRGLKPASKLAPQGLGGRCQRRVAQLRGQIERRAIIIARADPLGT